MAETWAPKIYSLYNASWFAWFLAY